MRGIAAYQSVSKQSAPPERLLLMLYQRAIQLLQAAALQIQAGDTASAQEGIRIAREIIVELLNALDHETAPELTGNLHRLYSWSIRELVAAGRDYKIQHLRNVLDVIEPLYEAWQGVLDT